jgi:hypothetical protein
MSVTLTQTHPTVGMTLLQKYKQWMYTTEAWLRFNPQLYFQYITGLAQTEINKRERIFVDIVFGLFGEGKTELLLLLVGRFVTLSFTAWWCHHGRPQLHPTKTDWNFRQSLQAAFTLKVHYHNFHNFTVLFQPHSVIKHRLIPFWLHWAFKYTGALPLINTRWQCSVVDYHRKSSTHEAWRWRKGLFETNL